MSDWMLLLPIVGPAVLAGIVFLIPRNLERVRGLVALAGTAATLIFSIFAFIAALGGEVRFTMGWAGFGLDLALRCYQFSAFIVLAVSGFAFLITLYSLSFMRRRPGQKSYYGYLLLTVSLVIGAVFADNLIVMLFFWEGLLGTLFGLILSGGKTAHRTAIKALVLNGVADLCLLFGVGLTVMLSGSPAMGAIQHLPADGLGALAYVLMLVGATAKAGALPLHTWIPDAAVDAPLPFMAFLPASLDKLLGIYLLARVSLDFFAVAPGSWMSTLMMILGAATILIAVLMALAQERITSACSPTTPSARWDT